MLNVLNILERKPESCYVFDIDSYDKEKSLSRAINNKFSADLTEYPVSVTFKQEMFQSYMLTEPYISDEYRVFADEIWNRLYKYVEV